MDWATFEEIRKKNFEGHIVKKQFLKECPKGRMRAGDLYKLLIKDAYEDNLGHSGKFVFFYSDYVFIFTVIEWKSDGITTQSLRINAIRIDKYLQFPQTPISDYHFQAYMPKDENSLIPFDIRKAKFVKKDGPTNPYWN